MLSVAPAFSLKIINSGEATEKFILLLILVIHFKVDPCPGGGTPIWNRRGCSSEILYLTPKGGQSGLGLSKF